MATTGGCIFILCTFLSCFIYSYALYEDQVGSFDWRQQYIGRYKRAYWEQVEGTAGGKRLFVSSEKNVIASLNTANGKIVWRKVFEEGRRGEVDDLIYNGEILVSVLGGRRVAAWSPGSGNLLWEIFLDGSDKHSGVVKFVEESGLVVALTSEKVYAVQTRDGAQKWEVELSNSETVRYSKLQVHDGKVYVVGMTAGSEVKVISIGLDGAVLSTKPVLAGFLRKDTKCRIVEEKYLMCICWMSSSFHVLNLKSPQGFVATSSQDLGHDLTEQSRWVEQYTPSARGEVIQISKDRTVLVTVNDNGKVSVIKDLPKSAIAAVVSYEGKDYIVSLEQTGHEELTMNMYELGTSNQVSEANHKIHYMKHHGQPLQMTCLLAQRKDGKMAYKLALLSEDYAVQLVHKSGKIAWRRDEFLAYAVAVEMVDLPVSENQAKFEDEFGSHEDNVMTMFVKRVKTQLSQLQTFIVQQIHRLQGVKHHTVIEEGEDEDTEDDDLLRDEFSLHKIIVIVTSPGKIVGMKSINGHLLWQHFLPELGPFDRFGREKVLLHVQRTTAHFPNPPQCVVLGRNRASGRGHLFAFDPISGHSVSQMPAGGLHLPYNIQQAFLLGEWDEHFMKALIMLDDTFTVHTYPTSALSFVEKHRSSIYIYLADVDSSLLNGYRLVLSQNKLLVDNVWTVNLQNQRQNIKITNIVAKSAHEHIYSQGRVLGDRSVLYKYLNPNVVVVTTEGEEPATSQQKGYPVINVYVLDVITGHMIFHGNHRKAQGPLHIIHSENWVVYGYFNTKQRRHEMAVLEMYEGKNQSNATVFSSFTAPQQPLVMRQSFIFPLPMYTMTTTITEKGITTKDILVALKNGGVFTLPKAFLDPRRPLTPTQETQEEGTFPYIPELPVHTEGMINYNQTLYHVRGIHTSPTGLESTSLILCYGLDMFHTRIQPSKMFDVLKEDFEHWLIASVVLSMLVASFITQKLASRKALNRQWK
ncbi:ER membrane protein complex subunit 1-like [Mercenaria mercenaria]|uniref:ER membrane protein complex subunit 1-like n=1 Tax=Mercenaria mercenaria TaxID=6596 RepID=UPI00234E5967|nr:ER membrane protein complex subunit 1-like [Mercenaria mercenaria]